MDLSPMHIAMEEARKAALRGEVPIGAVLCDPQGHIVAAAGNETRTGLDPTAHAEMNVIRRAAEILGVDRLRDCHLFVTLEPCPMCAGAISHARIKTLVFGAYDPKGGGVDHGPRVFDHPTCLHKPDIISGIEEAECGQILKDFFAQKR